MKEETVCYITFTTELGKQRILGRTVSPQMRYEANLAKPQSL